MITDGSAMYFVALALSSHIFQKPGGLETISHGMPQNYYKALVYLPDLSGIKDLIEHGSARQLTDNAFAEFVGGVADDAPAITFPRAARPAGGPRIGPAIALPLAILDSEEARRPPIIYDGDDTEAIGPIVINFASRTKQHMPRVFCYCNHKHEGLVGRCRLYAYVHLYETTEHAAAYLVAWRLMAGDAGPGQDHANFSVPDAGMVQHYYFDMTT
jgi:hypothetical protein